MASVLSGLIAVGPSAPALAGYEIASPTEAFSFPDTAASGAGRGAGAAEAEGAGARKTPVGSDGAFGHRFDIQVPPGRIGFGPRLGLQYSSSGARKAGNAGAGWNLPVQAIERDTTTGFPTLRSPLQDPALPGAGPLLYDDQSFLTPAGRVVRTNLLPGSGGGPTTATGVLYLPLFERSPVRYEYLASTDQWVEHDPAGTKRYFGQVPGGSSARVQNGLGTFAWLLVREVDAFNNSIDYEYHGVGTVGDISPAPILRRVRWGGNVQLGSTHLFEVVVVIEPASQVEVDLMRGSVRLQDRIDRIQVRRIGATTDYWAYDLAYQTSRDTGRDLLVSVTRSAPGETSIASRFSYSNNDARAGLSPFAAEAVLPAPLASVYSQTRYIEDAVSLSAEDARLEALTPSNFRSGYKLMDFDGDADLDVVYHPAGLGPPASRLKWESSKLKLSGAWAGMAPTGDDFEGIPLKREFTAFADLDGDGDSDVLAFPPQEVRGLRFSSDPTPGHPIDSAGPESIGGGPGGGSIPAEFLCVADQVCNEMCVSADYHTFCGMVDPGPLLVPADAADGWETPESAQLHDEFGYRGEGPRNFSPNGPDGFGYPDTPPEFDPFLPYCGCIPMCFDRSCSFQNFETPPLAEEGEPNPIPGSPSAWIALNQSLPGGTEGPRSVSFRHWPPEVQERLSINWTGRYRATAAPLSTFQAPLVDLNGDGNEDVLLLKYKLNISDNPSRVPPSTTMVPRAYLAKGEHFVYDLRGPQRSDSPTVAQFTESLIEALHPGKELGCTESLACIRSVLTEPYGGLKAADCFAAWDTCRSEALYPGGVDFNVMPVDFNGDGLVDLAAAHVPAPPGGGLRRCYDGYRVLLNRGYRFETWTSATERLISDESWSAPRALMTSSPPFNTVTNPLSLIRNREPFCFGPGVETLDVAAIPPSMVQWVDINTDGRVDAVLAFAGYNGSDPSSARHVFLNTGLGFAKPSATFAPNHYVAAGTYLPSNFAFSTADRIPSANVGGLYIPSFWKESLSDTGRLVDLDGDGAVDILRTGQCYAFTPGAGPIPACDPPKWQRNLTVPPDELVRIDEDSGSYTTVSYVSAASDAAQATGKVVSAHLPSGLRVVDRVEYAAGPTAAGYSVESVSLSYENYVTASGQNDRLGFEKVSSLFQNRNGAATLETIRVTQWSAVAPIPVGTPPGFEHPLRGLPVRMTTETGSHVHTSVYTYDVSALGNSAVRVRPRLSELTRCTGAVCFADGSEDTSRDSYGFPALRTVGQRSGGGFVANAQRRHTLTYDHDLGRWLIGRSRRELVQGYTRNISGVVTSFGDLSDVNNVWSGPELTSVTRTGFRPASCTSLPTDDVTTYLYATGGMRIRETQGTRSIVTTPDALNLYPASTSVTVPQYQAGVVQGSITLTRATAYDLRTGQLLQATEPNGETWVSVLDSMGRPTAKYGPGNVLLEQHSYQDLYPTSVQSTIHRDGTTSFQRKAHLDGHGRTRAVVESAPGRVVRRSFAKFDAFGREIESVLPRTATTLDDITPAVNEQRIRRVYDGLDRKTQETRVDGTVLSWSYEAHRAVEVDGRGLARRQTFDFNGALTAVEHFSGASVAGAVFARWSYIRDGLGRLLELEDPDGRKRRFTVDKGGRVDQATLNFTNGSTPLVFALCHDQDDELARITTPTARTLEITRDPLGRPVRYRASQSGANTDVFVDYDGTPDARGRPSRLTDASGTTDYAYDGFGRRSLLAYAPSNLVKDGVTTVGNVYYADFDYDFLGNLGVVSFSTVGSFGTVDLGRLSYGRDTLGRLTGVSSDGPGGVRQLAQTFTYDVQERMTGASLGNGTTATWAYHATKHYLEDIHYRSGATTVARANYNSVDGNLNLLSERRWTGATGATPQYTRSHTYDVLDRLLSTTRTNNFPIPVPTTQTYVYSKAGNITTADGETYTYASGRNGEAVTRVVKGTTFTRDLTYDLDGWLASEVFQQTSGSTFREDRTYTFNAAGCLTGVATKRTNGPTLLVDQTTNHVCGQGGSRSFRRTRNNMTGTVSRVLRFADLAEIRPDDGVFLKRAEINGTVFLDEARDLSSGQVVTAQSGYVFQDIRGSVLSRTAYLGPASQVNQLADYDSWGATISIGGTLPRHQYAGQEPDPGDGLYHFGARVYHPGIRRWISPDPLILGRPEIDTRTGTQQNLYAYAANNPVMRTDRNGGIAPVIIYGSILALALILPNHEPTTDVDISQAIPVVGDMVAIGRAAHSWAKDPNVQATAAFAMVAGIILMNPGPNPSGQMAKETAEVGGRGSVGSQAAQTVDGSGGGLASSGAGGGRDLHAEATAARDRLAQELQSSAHPPATVVGAYSSATGRVTAGASRGGGRGCAEGVCSLELGNPADIKFTTAVRPRTGQSVDVCFNCEKTYGRAAFPDPATKFKSDKGGQ